MAATLALLVTPAYSPYVSGARLVRVFQSDGDPAVSAATALVLAGAAGVVLAIGDRLGRLEDALVDQE